MTLGLVLLPPAYPKPRVNALIDVIVVAVVAVPLMVMPAFAVMAPASTTAELALDELLIVTEPAIAVMVPVAVLLTPALLVALVLVDTAVRLIFPVVEVNADVR
jgi:hypothetical protein